MVFTRRPRGAIVLALVLCLAGMTVGMSLAWARSVPPRPTQQSATAPPPPVRWVTCHRDRPVRCGYLTVPLDRANPTYGTINIFFELYSRSDPRLPALEPIVATEGGPGFSTTASRASYIGLFRPLMTRHDLLLVDNRGTGLSGALNCKKLQSFKGNYQDEVEQCGRQLGPTAELYDTHNAVEDLAAVLAALHFHKIDLYGDSYGSFFSQTFAVRYPQLVRAVVLDSTYSVQWPDAWYSDTNPAIVEGFRLACERWPACAQHGDGMIPILRLLNAIERSPITGTAPDANGVRHRVTINPGTLGQLMTDAATTSDIYRELDAAATAALGHDTAPLLRLLAEDTDWGGGGPVRRYSEALYDAVSCNDYPQAYDMQATQLVRKHQYEAAIANLKRDDPIVFWPFTVNQWVNYPEEYWATCLRWPSPRTIDPPIPAHARYPDVPVLVLSGDLDSLTSPQGALATAAHFPDSTFVSVANSGHVTALGDFGHCASQIVLRFFETLHAGDTSCAAQYPPIRVVGAFAVHAADLGIHPVGLLTATVAADTVADVIARWPDMSGTHGVGLRGGHFTVSGDAHNPGFRLHAVRWVEDIAVSGTIDWERSRGPISASVTVSGPGGLPGHLTMSWDGEAQLPRATVTGVLAGQPVAYSFLAP